MKVVWTEPALARLQEIVSYLATSDALAAKRIARRIETVSSLLSSHPELGRPTKSDVHVRRLVISGTRYILIYELKGDRAEILTVFHSRRAPPARFA